MKSLGNSLMLCGLILTLSACSASATNSDNHEEDLVNSIMASRPCRGFYNTKWEGMI